MSKNKHNLKASELIAALQKLIAEYGDLEVTVNTQEGASYNLHSEDDISIVEWICPDNSKLKTIEIG